MVLQASSYSILATLRGTPRHGWSVLQELRGLAGQPPAVATIYATLERLRAAHLIEEVGTEVVNGRARVTFRITNAGVEALHQHAEHLVQLAQRTLTTADRTGLVTA